MNSIYVRKNNTVGQMRQAIETTRSAEEELQNATSR